MASWHYSLPDTAEGENFEAFLARYDENGDIVWAQTSGMPGMIFGSTCKVMPPGRLFFWGIELSVVGLDRIFPK